MKTLFIELLLRVARPIDHIVEHLSYYRRLYHRSSASKSKEKSTEEGQGTYLSSLITDSFHELDTPYSLVLAGTRLVLGTKLCRRTWCVVI
jgi:hypothetical protein